jgi:hypothetical protein
MQCDFAVPEARADAKALLELVKRERLVLLQHHVFAIRQHLRERLARAPQTRQRVRRQILAVHVLCVVCGRAPNFLLRPTPKVASFRSV